MGRDWRAASKTRRVLVAWGEGGWVKKRTSEEAGDDEVRGIGKGRGR